MVGLFSDTGSHRPHKKQDVNKLTVVRDRGPCGELRTISTNMGLVMWTKVNKDSPTKLPVAARLVTG